MAGVYQIYPKQKRSFFKGLSVNTNLILINVICFILFSILLSLKVISVDSIAIKPLNIFQGKYVWTFLTSMFMHGGFFHIFANMLSLFFIGGLIEKILGAKRYLYFYLTAGLFAGLFFVLSALVFPNDLNAYAVGASGALFGVAGLMVILTPNLPLYIMFIPIPIKAKYAIPGLLIVLWLVSVAPMAFGAEQIPIGNTAHFGGLIAGLVYGVYLKKKYPNKLRNISRVFS